MSTPYNDPRRMDFKSALAELSKIPNNGHGWTLTMNSHGQNTSGGSPILHDPNLLSMSFYVRQAGVQELLFYGSVMIAEVEAREL